MLLPFADLYVAQIFGMMAGRRYSGAMRLELGKGMANLKFERGMLMDIHFANLEGAKALAEVFWEKSGMLELRPETYSGPRQNLDAAMDDIILQSAPRVAQACPTLLYLHVTRADLKHATDPRFRDLGFNILLAIKRGTDLATLEREVRSQDFWRGLFHLACHGQITSSYGPVIGTLVRRVQRDLSERVATYLGPGLAKEFHSRVLVDMTGTWPGWKPLVDYEALFGTAPYRSWAKSIHGNVGSVGATAITQRCYKQALDGLDPEWRDIYLRFVEE